MSRHEGVSCDSCLKGNFRERRYKCLICYDYDLCAACCEAGATNTRHNVDHPMQCILTRADFDIYYGGETLANSDQPQSYTCPHCSRMGFTDVTLQEHVAADHADASTEVVCPVCAAMPGGDPNFMTDNIARHLTLEHSAGPQDLISFHDDAVTRHNVHRISHSGRRGVGGTRTRRSNMHFSVYSPSSPSSRETVDPLTQLLSQLSGVRRSATSTPTQLQQLQMQLQMESPQVSAVRQQLERLPRRQTPSQNSRDTGVSSQTSNLLLSMAPPTASAPVAPPANYFLLDGLSSMQQQAPDDEEEMSRRLFLLGIVESTMVRRESAERVVLTPRLPSWRHWDPPAPEPLVLQVSVEPASVVDQAPAEPAPVVNKNYANRPLNLLYFRKE